MLNEAGVPRGRTWVHPPAPAGSLAGTVLVAVASSLATLTAMLLLLPGLGRGVAAPHSGGTPSEAFAPAWSEPPLEVAEVFRRSAPAVFRAGYPGQCLVLRTVSLRDSLT